MKKFLLGTLFAALISSQAFAAAINEFPPGFRLIDGAHLNEIVEAVNNLTGNGTAGTQAVTGVANGYKIARGEQVMAGNPTNVTTGLTSITSCTATLKGTATPGLSASVLTYGSSGGTLALYAWRPTSSSVTTLVALSSNETPTVGWVCVGG